MYGVTMYIDGFLRPSPIDMLELVAIWTFVASGLTSTSLNGHFFQLYDIGVGQNFQKFYLAKSGDRELANINIGRSSNNRCGEQTYSVLFVVQ